MFDNLSDKFAVAFKNIQGKGKISESNIEETLRLVKRALLEADVNFKVVKGFIEKVKEKSLGEKVIKGVNPGEQFIKIMHDELTSVMGNENTQLNIEKDKINPILIVGLNGQGKTTFSGKLSLYLTNKEKKNVLLVPADTFRPAAKDQLIALAKQIEVDYFDSSLSKHPKEIALDALSFAEKNNKDVVIIDTAGRLHVDTHLMNEIKEVKEAISSYAPEVLMVADAMSGQEAVNVAKSFNDAINLTGIVLSKMDSDARGGAALSIKYVTGVPIKFISTGEKMKDLELFHPDRLAGRILDMGDVLSLVEKAEDAINEDEAENMMKRLEKGKFSVDDFMKQMDMIKKLGPMGNVLKMIPGMGNALRNVGDIGPAEQEMKKMRVIINSMTKAERSDYKLLQKSRIERISKGSGTTLVDINNFISKFSQMEKMMGGMMQMMNSGGGMSQLLSGGGMPDFKKNKSKKKKNKGGAWGGGFF